MGIGRWKENGSNSLRKEKEIKQLGAPKCTLSLDCGLLYPTQGFNEFRSQTLANVRREYTANPDFLQIAQLACCAYPLNSEDISSDLVEGAQYILPLMDGHHRLKVGRDEHDLKYFPVEVFSILQAQRFYHDRNVSNTMRKLFEWVKEANYIRSIEQLVKVRFNGDGFEAEY